MISQRQANEDCALITLETHEFYEQNVAPILFALARSRGRPELAPAGYEVLFGPPLVGADILFIGDQPGGGQELGELQQPADRHPMWPLTCDYADPTKSYRLAEQIRAILPLSVLCRCSGSERIFFRSPSSAIYQSWPRDLRQAVEDFSLKRLKQIIAIIQPKSIVFIGSRAMRALMSNHEIVLRRENGHFLLSRGQYNNISAIACRHLSGGWLRVGELDQIGKHIRAMIGVSVEG